MQANNNLKSYSIILLGIFILFFITTNEYSLMQEKIDSKDTYISSLKEKDEELNKLNELKQIVKSEKVVNEIKKYSIDFNESGIIKHIYDYAFNAKLANTRIAIKNISFSEGVKNELGFMQSNIDLSIRVVNREAMIKFINFLINKDSKYVFFIDTFNYPSDNREGSFDISLPLKLFYIK